MVGLRAEFSKFAKRDWRFGPYWSGIFGVGFFRVGVEEGIDAEEGVDLGRGGTLVRGPYRGLSCFQGGNQVCESDP